MRYLDNRWVRLCIFIVTALTTSCVYYGWQSFQKVLRLGGVYAWVCDDQSIIEDIAHLCDARQEKLQFLYSLASGCEHAGALIAGIFFDHLGPRICGLLGELMFGGGVLLLMFSTKERQMYEASMVIMGLSVNIMCFPMLISATMFPKKPAVVISMIIAAETGATAVSPILQSIMESTNVSFRNLWWQYLLCIWIPVTAVYVLSLPWSKKSLDEYQRIPSESPDTPSEEKTSTRHVTEEFMIENDNLETDRVSIAALGKKSSRISRLSSRDGSFISKVSRIKDEIATGASKRQIWGDFAKQLIHFRFYGMLTYYFVLMFQTNFFNAMAPSYLGDTISDFLGRITPAQAAIGVVFGFIVDYTTIYSLLYTLVGVAIAMFGCALIESEGLQYFTSILFVVFTSYVFTSKYNYCEEFLDSTHFGKLVGTMGFAGGMSSFMVGALPVKSYRAIIITCLCGGFFCLLLVLALHRHTNEIMKERKQEIVNLNEQDLHIAHVDA